VTAPFERSGVPTIVVLGRQGSGKGEQCTRLARRHQLEHVSTGELLRAAVRAGSELGRTSESHMLRGEPVPDDIVAGLVAESVALAEAEGVGVVLDGYPRTVAQADRLSEILWPRELDIVVHLDVPRAVAVSRLQNRRVCTVCGVTGHTAVCAACGGHATRRADDEPAAIGRRMSDYAREMAALLEWYGARGVLETVDGVGTPDEVEARITAASARHLAPGSSVPAGR